MSSDLPGFPELVSRACHYLRTPLASAFGFARTLERLDAVEGEHARYLAIVVQATEELGRLIDALALIARVEDGRLSLDRTDVATAELVTEACALVPGERVSAGGDGARVEVDRARWTAGLAWLAEATEHALPGDSPLQLEARPDGSVAVGPLPAAMDDRLIDGTGDLRARGALAVAHAHGGALAREGEWIVVRLAAT
ncbi:MAG: histidine kinase dimerization/phospho-acceptor domain-containing protein [Gaiellales bacterium]